MKDIMKIEDTMVLLDLVADGYATLTEKAKRQSRWQKRWISAKRKLNRRR